MEEHREERQEAPMKNQSVCLTPHLTEKVLREQNSPATPEDSAAFWREEF